MQKEDGKLSRRGVLRGTAGAVAAFTFVPGHVLGANGDRPASEKLNIAAIGSGGMGAGNINACSTENIVALCDVDDARAAETFKKFPNARRYKDFRVMLDKEDKNIDAVIVATPDHTHAVAAMACIKRRKHVYVQKPLAHSIYEVRMLTEAARKYKVQTQMGNQGHSSNEIRLLCEWIQDGAIGPVREVYAWSDRPVGGAPWSDFPIMARPKEMPPIPKTLDWDLWLGPVKHRPYHPIYCPLSWRGWWDFGTGALGDMGCHILDPAFWALKLGSPTRVEAATTHYKPEIASETYPRASMVRYEFPARGDMPPVKLTWFDGRLMPPRPRDLEPGRNLGTNGALLMGDKGTIMHGSHGAGGVRIIPETKMRAYGRPPKTLPRVKGGHEQDWVRACKDGKPASSNFEYGGTLTEMVLLGVLAMRLKNTPLEWDAANLKVTNCDEAAQYVKPVFREGWTL
ncbi:MAG: Gfo/Idh/MocA family oxidoreductase [Sedimentisphaerales bacterium]|nr:Gfo/Idh/MocA family oxidoreductase [Sedimentisphaerales bacterium]